MLLDKLNEEKILILDAMTSSKPTLLNYDERLHLEGL